MSDNHHILSTPKHSVTPAGARVANKPDAPETSFKFEIPSAEFVTLQVFDLLGHEVAALAEERLQGGVHERTFDAGNLPSGVYFYRFQAGGFCC